MVRSTDDNTSVVTKTKESLLDSDNEDCTENEFKIDRKFAVEYEQRKRREDLLNHAAEDSSDFSSSDEESEDEDGELLTPNVDLQIFKTMNALRNKDQVIYSSQTTFFDEDSKPDRHYSTTKKSNKVADVIRQQVLQKMDGNSDEDDDNDDEYYESRKHRSRDSDTDMGKLAYNEEQREIRAAFLDSTKGLDAGSDEDKSDNENDDELLIQKKTFDTKNELELEQLQQKDELFQLGLKDPRGELEDADGFLMDFIKNKRWVDKDYLLSEEKVENDDAEEVDRMDEFESKYNFRFEQPNDDQTALAVADNNDKITDLVSASSGADYSIVGYARNSVLAIRRSDETRKEKRQARKERKAAERQRKEEHLRQLKKAKREEMEAKLENIRLVLGSTKDKVGKETNDVDEELLMKLMEEDYDPQQFEDTMSKMYGDDYYEKKDNGWRNDVDVKDSSNILGDEEEGDMIVAEENELHDNDMIDKMPDEEDEHYGNDDAGGEGWDEEGQEVETKWEKKLKLKMSDELYKLDYEDLIGDMPTRFKYRQVEANNYGLTPEEILFAKDTTLKQFVSLNKMAPYVEDGEYVPGAKKRRRFREIAKMDMEEILEKNTNGGTTIDTNEEKKKKRRRQKKGKKKEYEEKVDGVKNVLDNAEQVKCTGDVNKLEEGSKKKRSRKKKGQKPDKRVVASSHNDAMVVNAEPKTDAMVFNAEPKTDATIAETNDLLSATDSLPRKKKAKFTATNNSGTKKRSKVNGVSASRLVSYGL